MTRKPLIVHVLYRLDTGGMEQIVLALINRTSGRYRHAIVCLDGFGALRDRIADASIPCIALNKKPGKDWPHYVRFWRALRALKPDLVNTYNIGTLDLAPVVWLSGVRRIIHAEHGRDSSDPQGDNRKHHRLRRCAAPLLMRYVAVSRDLQRWLTERVGIRAPKVAYIPNGTDVATFDAARSRRKSHALLGDFAPPGTVLIVNIARLDKVKDHAGLISAFAFLRERAGHADCRLVIAGEGAERAELEQHIARLGVADTVRLLGNRDDVPDLLAECDVFALSSIAEGMPVTLLEAMAAGLPVVTTNVGGTASVVQAGKTGTLVPAKDPQALADAMGAYAADGALRRRHGDAGRALVAERFGMDAMVSAYVDLYDQCLGARCEPRSRTMSGMTDRGER